MLLHAVAASPFLLRSVGPAAAADCTHLIAFASTAEADSLEEDRKEEEEETSFPLF